MSGPRPSGCSQTGYHDAFVIEFENQAAADRYAKDPVHDKWTEAFLKIREASISPQITND